MYSTNTNDYQQYSHAPAPFGEAATTGVPVSATGQYYQISQPAAFHVQSSTNPNAIEKYSNAPAPFDQDDTDGVPLSSTNQSYEASHPGAPFRVQSRPPVPWSSGLCDCFSDRKNCKNLNFSFENSACTRSVYTHHPKLNIYIHKNIRRC
jgi:hypothetical protein